MTTLARGADPDYHEELGLLYIMNESRLDVAACQGSTGASRRSMPSHTLSTGGRLQPPQPEKGPVMRVQERQVWVTHGRDTQTGISLVGMVEEESEESQWTNHSSRDCSWSR